MYTMNIVLKFLLFVNIFTASFGYSVIPNVTTKLRNSNNKITMSLNDNIDRRDALKLPFKSIALSSLGLSITRPFLRNAHSIPVAEDYWTKHNGAYTEDEIKDYEKLPSGLLFKEIEKGTGKEAKDGDMVTINMVSYIYETGEKWCNTYKGIPYYQSTLRAGKRENQKYMKGLNEGLLNMKVGGKRILVIPAYLAYKYTEIMSEVNPDVAIIPGGSSLVCYVEMVEIGKK